MTPSKRKQRQLGSTEKQAGLGYRGDPQARRSLAGGQRARSALLAPVAGTGRELSTALGPTSGCCPEMALSLAPRGLPKEAPATPGTSLQGERPKLHPKLYLGPPSTMHSSPHPQPLRHFCTRRGTLMSSKCGLTYTPSYLLFIKRGRGPGGGPETGGGRGRGGG